MEDSTGTNSWTPNEYVLAVSAHACSGAGCSLYPGSNYENLAHFLSKPDDRSGAEKGHKENFASSVTIGKPCLEQFMRFQNCRAFVRLNERRGSTSSSHLDSSMLFLHGYPTPEWLRAIGATYTVDPEFIQRHLDIQSSRGKIDYFSLPSLPSSTSNILQMRITTLGAWQNYLGQKTTQSDLESLRAACDQTMQTYTSNLKMGRGIGTGDSIVRSFSVIDGMNFILEQDISACISRNGGTFTIIIWLDSGRDLLACPLPGPWISSFERRSEPFLYPIIQHRAGMIFDNWYESSRADKPKRCNFAQNASILDQEYGKKLDPDKMRTDPFYALSELWRFAAYSECQFLNMMDSKLKWGTESSVLSRDDLTLANLIYCKGILEEHVQRLHNNIICIGNKGGPEWLSRSPEAGEGQAQDDAYISRLLQDYEYLLQRAAKLASRCDQGMGVIMNNAVIAESKKAIEQTQEVAKLTRLAFFFIPLSFTASFLGMNLEQFGNGSVQLWIWFALSVPVFGLSVLLLYMDVAKLGKRFFDWVFQRMGS